MTDTSREAVEKMAADFEKEGRHAELADAMDDVDHVEWCMWMRNAGALLRALLAERDAAFQAGYAAGFDRGMCHGAETMRERAAAVAAGVEAHQETEAYAARLRCDSVADNECRIGSTAAGLIAAAIRALPPVQP